MQFCNDCGAILNLFEFPERELCSTCFHAETSSKDVDKTTVVETPAPACKCSSLPEHAKILYDKSKISIVSDEGWILWSGNIATPYDLNAVLQKAGQIYSIRKRRLTQK